MLFGFGIIWWSARHPADLDSGAAKLVAAIESLPKVFADALAAQIPTTQRLAAAETIEALPSPKNLRDRARKLSAEILQFLGEKQVDDLTRNMPPVQGLSPEDAALRWHQYTNSITAHHARTMQEYSQRFAARVIAAHDELAEAGLRDLELDRTFEHPTNMLGVRAVGERLGALAERLPEDEVSRLRKTVADIRPRRLTADQRAILVERLAPFAKEVQGAGRSAPSIHVLAGDGADCGDYARQFLEVFGAAGFRVMTHSPGTHEGDDFYYGLTVRWDSRYRDKYGFAKDGPVVTSALAGAGIEATTVEREGTFLSLIVGSRRA